jgi:DNA-binding response OmpR family regulator
MGIIHPLNLALIFSRLAIEPRMKARILWIEDKHTEGPSLVASLRRKGHSVEVVSTGAAALSRMKENQPDLVVLNAASMRTSGARICKSLRELAEGLPIVIITNPGRQVASDACANEILVLPFTSRKLINRITPLLPTERENVLRAGTISLDIDRKQVTCGEREARLTPRLSQLLEILIRHAGEVVEREHIFQQVWNTAYFGDTRTLDVHISWLRQAIEENPRMPRYIKTVRGLGYRLDV